MAFFASYLRHLLMLLDIRAEIAASPSQEALSRLGRIDAGTLVVGLSAGRPHPLVVRAMKIARHRGAQTLAIVDASLSDVSKLAARTLYWSSSTPAFVRSHTGLLSLLQALARSEEHTSELQSRQSLVCRLLLEKTKILRAPLSTPFPPLSHLPLC